MTSASASIRAFNGGRRTLIRGGCAVCLATLAACATVPGPGAPAPAEPRAITLADLEAELRRDLAGTPVQVGAWMASTESPALRVVVPQPHGFEAGEAAVRPALAAVLDRMAGALRGNPRWLVQVTGPIDPKERGFQGQDRAAAVRDYLVARGVAASRFQPPRSQTLPSTEIVVIDRPRRS